MRDARDIPRPLVGALAVVLASGITFVTAADKNREALDAVNRKFMEAVQKGDAAAAAALYTEDGQALPPNADPVRGREAIRALWQEVFDGGVKKAELESNDVEFRGDVAYEVGAYALFGADGGMIDTGKYIVIWKKSDGGWLLHRDIWNSNRPVLP